MRLRVSGRWEEFRITPVSLVGSSPYQVRRGRDAQAAVLSDMRVWLSAGHHDMHYIRPCVRVIQVAITDHIQAEYWLGLRGATPWDVLMAWARQQGIYIRGTALAGQKAVQGMRV